MTKELKETIKTQLNKNQVTEPLTYNDKKFYVQLVEFKESGLTIYYLYKEIIDPFTGQIVFTQAEPEKTITKLSDLYKMVTKHIG